mmetsp:Transcript_97505/g.258978  ORF Transcript_97505/g.258978 Transcript_97505/m.258978 type:complete len:107 (-) Transcript_97505:44-364(-)
MAFPCNQFGAQEPGSAAEIKAFAQSKGVPCGDPSQGFFMMEKVEVNGPNTHPVYAFLKSATADDSDIKWNFFSYWLVSPGGRVERLAGGPSSPAGFRERVDAALVG